MYFREERGASHTAFRVYVRNQLHQKYPDTIFAIQKLVCLLFVFARPQLDTWKKTAFLSVSQTIDPFTVNEESFCFHDQKTYWSETILHTAEGISSSVLCAVASCFKWRNQHDLLLLVIYLKLFTHAGKNIGFLGPETKYSAVTFYRSLIGLESMGQLKSAKRLNAYCPRL